MNEKRLTFRFVQEFDGAGIVIARRLAQAHRRLAQRLILLGRERRRGRFFQDFLVAALDGAVAHAGGPRGSVVVGNDLDLDVARALHQLLHENGGIAEGLERLGAGALEGLRKLVCRMHPANPVTAASGRGLNKKRIAQALGMAPSLVERFHRPAAPGRYRYLRLLGQSFRGDLVAQPPHHIAIRADEHDAQLAAKIGKCGVLGDKAPSHPDRLRARSRQRLFQPAIVDVTALELLGGWIEDLRGPRDTASSASRTNMPWRSGSVKSAMVRNDVPCS